MGPRTLLRNPQLAAARDCIRGGVIPDSGHLIHMASHIDVQLGECLLRSTHVPILQLTPDLRSIDDRNAVRSRYQRTIECNQAAVAADLRFKARRGAAANKVGVSTSKDGPAMYDLYCAHK
jgi:hypothetical protein